MENLKLKAEDIEDIIILSAYLQDAVTNMSDVVYQNDSRRFVIMLNRYVWENWSQNTGNRIQNTPMKCNRIRTGLHFDDVLKISSLNIDPSVKEQSLELLSIEARQTADGIYLVDFIFSGDGVIRLECEMISAHMQDIGKPWIAKCHPKHEILEALQDDNSQKS